MSVNYTGFFTKVLPALYATKGCKNFCPIRSKPDFKVAIYISFAPPSNRTVPCLAEAPADLKAPADLRNVSCLAESKNAKVGLADLCLIVHCWPNVHSAKCESGQTEIGRSLPAWYEASRRGYSF